MWSAFEPGALSRRVFELRHIICSFWKTWLQKNSKLKKNFDAVDWIGIINARISLDNVLTNVRGSADKSLARPTSRCSRTESIVSLERGVCSCAELQVFSCYRGNMSGDARDFNNIETRAVINFFL